MRLYFHIPFCRQRCGYCKFALVPYVQEAKIRRYLGFLLAEVDAFFRALPDSEKLPVESVYFGGGTPSTLSLADIRSILDRVRTYGVQTLDCEITLEANPEDLSVEYLRGLADLGITRLSLGIQTLSDETLRFIGRSGREDVLRAFDTFVSADTGMTLATDFIAGLPRTTVETAARDIAETFERAPIDHASVYMLEAGKYPPGYDFPEGDIPPAYFLAADALVERGLARYEVSNFARP